MPQISKPESVPAEVLHAGDDVIISRNGVLVPVRIVTTVHGSDMVSNIVILGCQPDGGGPMMTLPFSSDLFITRTHQNMVAAA